MSASRQAPTHAVAGSGEAVLFLNGGMMSWAGWTPVAARLGDGWRRVFFDFHGQLLSPGRPRGDLAEYVDDAVRVLDALGIARTHLIGTSFGAEVGLLLAATHPGRVISLAAITATDRATDELRRGIGELRETVRAVIDGSDRTAYLGRMIASVYSEPYRRTRIDELRRVGERVAALPLEWFEGLLGILDAIEGLDLGDRLAAIRCPVLVVHAASDALMPRERGLALARAIEHGEWLEHSFSGHALVVEDPEWLGDACRRWLERQREAPAGGEAASGREQDP